MQSQALTPFALALRFGTEGMKEVRQGLADLKRGEASLYTLEELFED